MDTNVLGLAVIVVFGVVAITGLVLFRQRARIGHRRNQPSGGC